MGISTAVAVGVQLYSAYESNRLQNKAVDAQNAALAEQRKQARMANIQQRRAEIRKSLQQQAQARAAAAARGVSNSSNLRDTLGMISTNTGTRLSFLDRMQQIGDRAYSYNLQANNYQQQAANVQATGQILSTGLNAIDNKNIKWDKLFN